MLRRVIRCTPLSGLAVSLLLLQGAPRETANPTALDRYVHSPDGNYRYDVAEEFPSQNLTVSLLRMTSQAWRSAEEVDRPVWEHWLTLYRPNKPSREIGLLFITGGANDGRDPKPDAQLAQISEATGSVVAELRMVPNQPLRFANDPYGPRVEDEMIAYTWDQHIRTGDETWPARLPMTKAAIRAMDTVTDFMRDPARGGHTVDRFFVSGASKRGWTTWTAAAVDTRVIAIAPLVIDLLNVERSFRHHYRVYGFWAPAVKDYFNMGMMDRIGDPQFAALMDLVDPYAYRERLTMPKFIMNAAGDQFFLPDSSRFYFDDLKGEKHLRYVPNTDHSLRGSDAFESLLAFYDSVLTGSKRPSYNWSFEEDGSIIVRTGDRPLSVRLWQATNPERRDFRLEAVGPIYTSTELSPEKPGVYRARVPNPEKGWTAYFVEMTFAGRAKHPFKFTTGVRVTPETLPFGEPEPGKTRMGTAKGPA